MLVWFDFIFLGDLNKCFPHFRSCCVVLFFFPPPLTCSRQQCYICILFLLTLFKEERANLQYNRQSGAMFQDEKRSLFINLVREPLSSSFHPNGTSATQASLGFWFLFRSLQTTYFSAKQKTKVLCLIVESLPLQYKRLEQPANSRWSPCWYLSALAQNHLLSIWKSPCSANKLKENLTQQQRICAMVMEISSIR